MSARKPLGTRKGAGQKKKVAGQRKPVRQKKAVNARKGKPPVQTMPRWRFYVVGAGLGAMFSLLVWQMVSLQILDSERGRAFLQDQGDARAVRTAEIPAYRGVISDRRGQPLAVSTPVVSLYVNPQRLDSADIPKLAAAMGPALSERELRARLKRYEGKQFMYLDRHWNPAEARRVLELGIRGVFSEREFKRYYPAGNVAAQLVGFTNMDGRGIEGIELAYDKWLRGELGRKMFIKDRRGDMIRDIGVVEEARPGRDLTLSIDLRLQYQHHKELASAVESLDAMSGSVVTLDSRTGEILAMANYPDYNPNASKGGDASGRRNRAATDAYEPGSTMKAMTLVAALESGRYSTETVIDTAPGWINVSGKVYEDPKNYKRLSLTGIMQKSSQVGITKIAMELGHEPLWDVLSRFGIGAPPGTGFPGESAGRLPTRDRWHVSEKISLAFGYGITATPLQLAGAYAVFANDGVQQPLSLLALEGEPPAGNPVVSADIANEVLDVLHAITLEEGTATKAQVPGYRVGGKTGTVHKVGPGGYAKDRYVALFAGVAPVDDPRIVTVVVINEPKGEQYGGGAAAAPVFSAITSGALRVLNIPPSEIAGADSSRPGGAA